MKGKGRSGLLSGIIYLGICATIYGSSLEVPPSNNVASVGDNVQFYCTIDGDPKFEAVAWKRQTLSGNKTAEDIFHTWPPDGKKIDETKYSFTENEDNPLETTIKVKNVAYTDAGRYSCEPTSHADGAMHGNLVVVGTPKIRLPTRLTQGKDAELVCEVRYLGPTKVLEAGQEPQIVTRLGNEVLHGNVIRTIPADPGQPYHLRSVYKKKMNSSLHKWKFSCSVQVHSPPIHYESTASRMLMVDFPVRNVKLLPVKKVYSPGDSVSCIAEGYPEPTIRWEMVPTKGTPGSSSVLHISHRWVCVASNVVGRVTRSANSSVVTYVDPTSIPRKDYTLVSVVVFVVFVLAVVTVCKLKSSRSRGNQQPQMRVSYHRTPAQKEDLEGKGSVNSDTGTDPNGPMLQNVKAYEVLPCDDDDTSKRHPQPAVPLPSSNMSGATNSFELAPPMDEIVSAESPLCDPHHEQTCTNLFEDQS